MAWRLPVVPSIFVFSATSPDTQLVRRRNFAVPKQRFANIYTHFYLPYIQQPRLFGKAIHDPYLRKHLPAPSASWPPRRRKMISTPLHEGRSLHTISRMLAPSLKSS